jgi:hypothetical protein
MSPAELAALAAALAAAGEQLPTNEEVRRQLGFGLLGAAAECPR